MALMTADPVDARRDSPVPRGRRTRVTPARLRLAAVALAILAVVAGAVTALAAAERHTAAVGALRTAEPLVVQAQAIDTYLSDADTTAAGSFLDGPITPSALRTRYMTDLARAAASLAAATEEAGGDPATTSSIRALAVDLPIYSGLVQTATVNERQGYYPLAAAYIAEANNLMRTALLPAATQLYAVENQRLASDQDTAVSVWLVALAGVLLVALLVGLLVVQVKMSRHFRRTFNLSLVVATVATLVLGIWFTAAVAAQNAGVDTATADGSGPLVVFTQARIGALRMTADDELTLLTRDSTPSNQPGYQKDYDTTVAGLRALLARADQGAGAPEADQIDHAVSALDAYGLVHAQIRKLDGSGEPTFALEADGLASGTGPNDLPAVSSTLDLDLAQAIAGSQQAFDQSMSSATGDIAGLIWASAILSVLVAVLVLVGFRPRIAEYR